MKVTVIGPGAMGCLFAARLDQSGATTTLVDHSDERAKRLAKSGITVESDTETLTAMPVVTTTVPAKQDLILVLTKSAATASLELPSDVPVLTLQNGLGNVEALCDNIRSSYVLAGTTSEASTQLDEGRVRHSASGLTVVGSWTSCPTDAAVVALKAAGFKIEVTDSPGQTLWEKAVISAGINTLTALLNVPNGHLVESEEARMLMRDLVVEAAKVASMEGYRFDRSLVEHAETVCRETATNISSMLQDLRAGRKTEIEAISGEIMRRGDLAALPTPRTRMIYQLIRSMEDRRRGDLVAASQHTSA